MLLALALHAPAGDGARAPAPVAVRGIYGGLPESLMEGDSTLEAAGVNAVWIGERGVTAEGVARLKAQGALVFAEFNTLHRAEYLEEHPDAAPRGPDGEVCPAPHGWQGICPTHAEYRRWRMEAFETLLAGHELDGVWLDYHHAHASWERADPVLPDTCFCVRCRQRFAEDTGLEPDDLLGARQEAWTRWRCGVFTDWVREFREILDRVRPAALLGTFHCPWPEAERDGALRNKLAIDLRAQAAYLDVFSPMPYHARFGHPDDPAWISRSTAWLGAHVGVTGKPGERLRIWPIVQLADWGEEVPVEQFAAVLDHAIRSPSTGVTVFAWGGLRRRPDKVAALVERYRVLAGGR